MGEAEEQEEDKGQLPEGFFDDPELDAKVRGTEAPSVKAERELEEGLKRFEREMAQEQELAEEKRHEIDEEMYASTAADEQEFQSRLQSRLEALRKRTKDALAKKAEEAAASAPVSADASEANEDDEDADDDDDDVE